MPKLWAFSIHQTLRKKLNIQLKRVEKNLAILKIEIKIEINSINSRSDTSYTRFEKDV